ncbi:site-specific integrase [Vibrio alginolyticus]|nr:site-specific integrase [Vibrio alginolyticus]
MDRSELKRKARARTIQLEEFRYADADISLDRLSPNSNPIRVEEETYFIDNPHEAMSTDGTVYHFPMLFHADMTPFHEANLFLLSLVTDRAESYGRKPTSHKRTDAVKRIASILIEYKLFCENNDLDYLDLSQRRLVQRPTHKYYKYLCEENAAKRMSGDNLNLHTKVVYDFYKYLAKQGIYGVDLERVDNTKDATYYRPDSRGITTPHHYVRRSQTVRTSNQSVPLTIGYVNDEGESLRPLVKDEQEMLLKVLQTDNFRQDERLMSYMGMYTGARKQTILTIRMKHLERFQEKYLRNDNTYLLNAGIGNGIDTKFSKAQDLYIPKALAEQIVIYARSPLAARRRRKFIEKNGHILNDEDMYVFISDKGECHYMAKDDPRYRKVKSKPEGKKANELAKKILALTPDEFPSDFVFHWLRATFALKYYYSLMPLVAEGKIEVGDEISMVQKRMHHAKRETTEDYLKLFMSIDYRRAAQNEYESILFDDFDLEVVGA